MQHTKHTIWRIGLYRVWIKLTTCGPARYGKLSVERDRFPKSLALFNLKYCHKTGPARWGEDTHTLV